MKSCRIITTQGVTSVFDAEGSFSKLYSDALNYTNNVEEAVKIWSITQTELWDEQMDSKDEPSLGEVLRFVQNTKLLQEDIPTLTEVEVGEVKNIMYRLGVTSLQDMTNLVNSLFQPKGVFEINSDRLTASGLYSVEDIEAMNVKKVRDFVARLNIYNSDNDVTITTTERASKLRYRDTTAPKNILGFHNIVKTEEIAQSVANITNDFTREGIEEALVDTEFQEGTTNRAFVQDVLDYLSNKQVVSKWSPSGTKTQTTVTNTVIENSDTLELEEKFEFLSDILPSVWENNLQTVKNYLKKVEQLLVNFNLDVVGLSENSNNRQGTLDLIESSLNLLNDPSEENIQTFSEAKDSLIGVNENVTLRVVDTAYQGYALVEASHNMTQDELFESQGLIQIGEDLYHKVMRDVTIEELYDEVYNRVISGEIILDAKYFNDSTLNLKDPLYRDEVVEAISRWVNSRDIGVQAPVNGEEISLYQVLFNHKPVQKLNEVYKEVENFEYLESGFVTDFYNYVIQEKLKNSSVYNNTLKWFNVEDGDITYNNPSGEAIDLTGVKYEQEIKDYATLKKQGLIKAFATQDTIVNEDIEALNNPKKVGEITNTEYIFEDQFLITKGQNPNLYVRQGGKLYRRLLNDAQASVYGQVLEGVSNIYKDVNTDFQFPQKEAEKALEKAYDIFGNNRTKDVSTRAKEAKIAPKQEVFNFAESEVNSLIDSLLDNGEITYTNDEGIPCAKEGMYVGAKGKGVWSLVEDLKGKPSHKLGGVDLEFTPEGVSFINSNSTKIKASNGLLITKDII